MTAPDATHLRPAAMADRLIVALDVGDVAAARELVRALDGCVRFFKIGLWLFVQREASAFIDELVGQGSKVFLDYKMYDIGETVRRGVASAASRGVSFLTVHGDPEIMRAAVDGRGDSGLAVLAVSVLTSQDDAALAAMGYGCGVQELIALRARNAGACGCDGLIASPTDRPDALRAAAGRPDLLVVTPGIRLPADGHDEHARAGTPMQAIRDGADYLVVGRPVIRAASPAAKAREIVAAMEAGAARP